MSDENRWVLETKTIQSSAPCRIDMGGTLDIPTFYYPLRHLKPCTFNIALDLRTQVRLRAYKKGRILISSTGFKDTEYVAGTAPFDHPLGLMFATAAYFNAQGVHIEIDSQSPIRSALGGSSVAVVALVGAFSKLTIAGKSDRRLNRRALALLAYNIEQSVAGVACGIQDQLAATYGGVNVWYLRGLPDRPLFKRKTVIRKNFHRALERHIIVAYCGKPHLSADINSKWVKQFLAGKYRDRWAEIVACTHQFVAALADHDFTRAAMHMNKETAIRKKMTPGVLDKLGDKLVDIAVQTGCGARFTGAGGGGCLWALGKIENIDILKPLWEETLSSRSEARLLDVAIDSKGLVVD